MGIATYYLSVNSLEEQAKALARGLRRRDPELLEGLIEQYHYRLFRYLVYLTGSHERAEDLFQETWVRVLERGYQYDGKRKFESWLFAIARNLTIDWLRSRKPVQDLEDTGDTSWRRSQEGSDLPSPDELVSRRQASERVQTALGQLPAAQREVLLLRFQEDLNLEEIAAITAAPLSTVKSRLYRSLQELRELLAGGNA